MNEDIKDILDSRLSNFKDETLSKKIIENYNFLISLGYSKEEVIKMTKTLPTIYGLSIENIRQKVDYYDSIGLKQIVVEDTRQLIQSTALSYARYEYYTKEHGMDIDMSNYLLLFMGNKQFEKRFNITKKQLLGKYNYQRDMEENNRARNI